ncbi:Mitochondrial Carrier (MC) Family [Thraustotheca clavata]|uniref:Mitochondrial Carrier (MC) Family n=1 Tax=Thraustotheca clavata TaxID=74557 RepID=A0A1V9ZRM6_9STRA|nr:Mitochondrial Carrier (MC) Family [Thraustotheca clavata]
MSPTDRRALYGVDHAIIGSLSGMAEVLIQQPTVYVKNALQQGQPLVFQPKVMYRGVGINCLSIAPICAVQFAANGVLGRYISPDDDIGRILTAMVAGALSSLLSSPAELVMTLQQRTGQSIGSTVQEIVKSHGITRLYRGLPLTMFREASWCACYLALGPVVSTKLHHLFPNTFGEKNTATTAQKTWAAMGGSIAAGLVAVLASQPIDTLKTIVQGNALDKAAPSLTNQAKQVWNKGGMNLYYKGTVPRGIRLIGAVFIMSGTKEYLEDKFSSYGV